MSRAARSGSAALLTTASSARRAALGGRSGRHVSRALRPGLGLEVEQQQGQLDGRLAVDQRVVHLEDQPGAAVLEQRHEMEVPERPCSIERL